MRGHRRNQRHGKTLPISSEQDTSAANCIDYYDCIGVQTHSHIITSDATKATTRNFFTTYLNNIVDIDSFLYIWVYDHGGDDGTNAWISCWGPKPERFLFDYEFVGWLTFSNYDYKRIVFTMGQCSCGGFIDEIRTLPGEVIISTAITGLVDSHSALEKGYMYHHGLAFKSQCGEINVGSVDYTPGRYTGISADKDNNKVVSFYEAFIYASENPDYAHIPEIPDYWDSGFLTELIGPKTFL